MFSKISRYNKQADVIVFDVEGQTIASKSFRLHPVVTGSTLFLHTLEESERLDHLSFKYYNQSRKWWRICDANPDFMSPLALVGKEPILTYRFPLSFDAGNNQPPWADLIRQLSQIVGVVNYQIVDEVQIVPEVQTISGSNVKVYHEQNQRAIILTYNRMNVSAKDLVDAIEAAGFIVAEPQNLGRAGKSIIIPQDTVE